MRASSVFKEKTWALGCLNSMHSFLCLGCCWQAKTISDLLSSQQLFSTFKILIFCPNISYIF